MASHCVTVNQISTWHRDAHVQTACTCHSLHKACQQKGSVALRSLVAHSFFSDKIPNHVGLHLSPELEDHSWQDPGQCCCPSSFFSVGIKVVGILLSTPQSLIHCFCFFFSFFFLQRESARVGRERGMYYITRERGGSILFCRAWFVITLAIKRKTMFVYRCFYSISSSSGTGRAAFSKKRILCCSFTNVNICLWVH